MKKTGSCRFQLSSSDLVGYLNSGIYPALTAPLPRSARKTESGPTAPDFMGARSIHADLSHAICSSRSTPNWMSTVVDGVDITDDAVKDTLAAMKLDTAIIRFTGQIVQGALSYNGWSGRADILRRVKKPSAIGDWSYEVIDTKLARETKAGTVLQLCLYSDLLTAAQGTAPEYMHVVAPWSDFEPQQYRFTDYAAYFRKVQHALRQIALRSGDGRDLSRSQGTLQYLPLAGKVRQTPPGR